MSAISGLLARAGALPILVFVTAAAAGEDPQSTQPTDNARSAVAVPLNSGAAPQEFPADASKVTLERLPNGTRLYRMNGQGMESMQVHIGPDGKLTYTCSDAADGAAAPQSSASHSMQTAHER